MTLPRPSGGYTPTDDGGLDPLGVEDDLAALFAAAPRPDQLPQAGDLKMSAATAAPAGWLACDASAVSRTTYAALFAAIGTTFGAGDGSTTFNVPDFRGRVPVGPGNGDATGHTNHVVGTKYGEQTHTLTLAESPAHTHTLTTNSYAVPQTAPTANVWSPSAPSGALAATTDSQGGGGAHENRTPSLGVNFYIKT